jgi:hypothetical protein
MRDRREIFEQMFRDLSASEQVDVYNRCAERKRYESIKVLDEFVVNEEYQNYTPWEIISAWHDCNIFDDWWVLDGMGNIETMGDDDVIDYIEDYLDTIYEHESVWNAVIDEDELNDMCAEEFREYLTKERPDATEDMIELFMGEYFENMCDPQENLEEFDNLTFEES